MFGNNKPNGAISGISWKFAERILAQSVSFLVSIVLARVLMPEQYGTISLVLVFINIANAFVTNGLGLSLIQKKDADDVDFSTIFYCSLILGLVLYMIVFICAPLIASSYGIDDLVIITRILSIKIIIASINSVQHAYVSKHFLFQKFFISTLFGTVFSGIIGIIMALNGFGVWALVTQYILNSFIDTILLFITVNWKPKLLFSFSRAKSLLSYAWKLMLSGVINTTFSQIKNLVIGRIYSKSDLAYYEKGNYFPQIVINNLNSAISDVVFPFMAKDCDNIYEVKRFARKSLRMISYFVSPCMAGMMVISNNFIIVLLTNKWIECVPYLRIMCIYWLTQPLQTVNWQAIKAVGRSDICLKLEIVKKGISIVALISVMKISVSAIAITSVLLAIFSVVINAIPVAKLLKYTLFEQILDVLPSFLLSAIMAFLIFPVSLLQLSPLVILSAQCFLGVLVYMIFSKLLMIDEYFFLVNRLKTFKIVK